MTQLVTIITGLVYTPVMLRILGQSEYGLYQLVYSVVSYLGLLSFGFGTGYMRFYARYKVKNDQAAIARLNGMFMIIFLVIAGVCLLCGGVMTVKADAVFGSKLTAGEISKARILMAMMVFNMALSFVTSVFTSNITAYERFFFQRIVEFFKSIFNPFLTFPILIMGYGSVGMVFVTTVLTIAVFCINLWYCLQRLKIRFSFKGFDFDLLKEMSIFTFFIFINMIVDQLNWNVDKFLLGRMMGTSAVAVYGVAAQLNTMYLAFSTNISSVFTPRINVLVASGKSDFELTKLFVKVGRIQFLIAGLIISGFILYGREFIVIWAGDEYASAYRVGLMLMLPVTVPIVQNLGLEIQRAKNKHKARSVVYLSIALANVFVSIPCIMKWGINGAAFGTAITMILGNGIFMNIYYHVGIGLDILYFWRQIIKMLPPLAIAVVVGIAGKMLISCTNFAGLCINIVIYSLAYALSMWFMGINDDEKNLFCLRLRQNKIERG